jgi:hypothetical protein
MSNYQKEILWTWILVTLTALGIFLGVLIGKGDYSVYGYEEACLFPGAIIILVGLLFVVASLGAFDIFAFGFRSVFSHMNPDPNHVEKYRDYVQYREVKKDERAYHKPYLWPFWIIGVAFLIAMAVLRIILATT